MKIFDNHLPTAQLQALDMAHHLHPFTDEKSLHAKGGARVIVRAEGVWIYDSEGCKILDAMSGLWCVNIGYGRKELADIAYRQMQQLPYYNSFFETTHPPAVALAQKLAERVPGRLNHAFFASSGSESNDTHIRLSRHYHAVRGQPEKKIIIARKNAYHGSSVGSASLGGMRYMHAQGGLPIPDIVHIDQPYWYGEGEGSDQEAFGIERARQLEETILRLGVDKVAAFIAEPIQGAGGVIIPPKNYWPEIKRICKEHDVLLILDEVISGFGRTGKWFGAEYFDLDPDLMTLAKGLSSGYAPISAAMVSDEIAQTLYDKGEEFNHGYTYSGHPVCAAVALENIRIIEEEQLIEKAEKNTLPLLAEKWLALADHDLVGEARMVGFLGGIELTRNKKNREKFPNHGRAGTICRTHCFKNNLIMRAVGDTMVICPPLTINEEEIDILVTQARKSLDGCYKSLREENLL